MNDDNVLNYWSESILLGFGIVDWDIAQVFLSCVVSNACGDSSCHYHLFSSGCSLSDSYGT